MGPRCSPRGPKRGSVYLTPPYFTAPTAAPEGAMCILHPPILPTNIYKKWPLQQPRRPKGWLSGWLGWLLNWVRNGSKRNQKGSKRVQKESKRIQKGPKGSEIVQTDVTLSFFIVKTGLQGETGPKRVQKVPKREPKGSKKRPTRVPV